MTPGVDLDLRNATINPIKVYTDSGMLPLYFSEYLTIDENNAIGCRTGGMSYIAITFDSNGNLLDFYYGSKDA